MIKLIKDKSFFPDLSKSVHFVTWTPVNLLSKTGYSQMSWADPILRYYLPDVEIETLFRHVDKQDETGTLYPKVNITIMPSIMQPYSDEEIYSQYNDFLKVQNNYIQADKVVFDMRNYSYINPYTNLRDDEEYLYMIDYSLMMKRLHAEEVYVVMIGEYRNIHRYVDFRYATEEEIKAINLDESQRLRKNRE